MAAKPHTIDEYLAGLSPENRTALQKLRRAVHAAPTERHTTSRWCRPLPGHVRGTSPSYAALRAASERSRVALNRATVLSTKKRSGYVFPVFPLWQRAR